MARFKVGDRVRIARDCGPTPCRSYIGKEGVVTRVDLLGLRYPIDVAVPGMLVCCFWESELEPILPRDDKADEFIQSMERFAKKQELLEVRGGAV